MTILIEEPGPGIRLLTINRPERRNALDTATYQALSNAITQADADPDARVLVLTGAGGNFTSGNDLADFQKAARGEGPSAAIEYLRTLVRAQKPVIAAVEGNAVGIGTTMLLHCDLAYAGEGARLHAGFVPLGLCPEGASSYLLPRIAGSKKAAEILLFGEPFSAAQGAEAGLVNRVVPSGEALATALERARALSALPAASVAVTKKLLRRADRDAVLEAIDIEAAHFAERLRSPEAQAAFAAFFAKRSA